MKKKAACIVILTGIVFLMIYFIPVTNTKQANIDTNFDNAYRILNDMAGWEKWHPAIAELYKKDSSQTINKPAGKKHFSYSNNNDSISINKVNAFTFEVAGNTKKAGVFSYVLTLIPSQSTYTITVSVNEKIRLLYKLLPSLQKKSAGEEALYGLKNYFENSHNIYGFTIKNEKTIIDTVYAVIEAAVATKDVFKTMQQRFILLNKYVKEKGLKQTGFSSISYIPQTDSVFLITGMKVNKLAEPMLPVHCVNIPKGNMLTAYFEGRFSERNKIYEALERYAKDHFFRSVGSPIESYIDNKIPESDSSIVRFKFYYPIR